MSLMLLNNLVRLRNNYLLRKILVLGYQSCVLVGHDWGAIVSWTVAMLYVYIFLSLLFYFTSYVPDIRPWLTNWSYWMCRIQLLIKQIYHLHNFVNHGLHNGRSSNSFVTTYTSFQVHFFLSNTIHSWIILSIKRYEHFQWSLLHETNGFNQ